MLLRVTLSSISQMRMKLSLGSCSAGVVMLPPISKLYAFFLNGWLLVLDIDMSTVSKCAHNSESDGIVQVPVPWPGSNCALCNRVNVL